MLLLTKSDLVYAKRNTPEWKIEIGLDEYYNRQKFDIDDATRTFTTESRGAELLVVKSLEEHWSAGISAEANHSTRNNYNLRIEGSPALEYSVFPYREYNEREITILYRVTGGYYDYIEMTIFGQAYEYLARQQLRANIELTQPWGELDARFDASTYLHDLKKNRLSTRLRLNFRIYRGLSVFVFGRYSWINDQLSIPAGDITDAEQLLDLRVRFTSYSYDLRVGLQFSFGSIYNNVVNPRL